MASLRDSRYILSKAEKDLIKSRGSFSWFIFTVGYLFLAEVGCEKLLSLNKETIEKKPSVVEKDIVFAIMYNVQHSLEILLKFVTYLIDKIEKKDEIHDTAELLNRLKIILKKKINKSDFNDLEIKLCHLEGLIYSYQDLWIIREYLTPDVIFFHDKNNMFFRYPEDNKVKIDVDYPAILDKIKVDDISKILIDIREIKSIVIEIDQSLKKSGLVKNNVC